MGLNKRYYWLKLKEDFFRDKRIKKLRRIAGGDTFTIIYLKMQLLALKDEGKLYFENIESSFVEEIALEIDEDIENVQITIAFLLNNGLLEEISVDEYALPQTMSSIGTETQVAERVRRHRNSTKALQSNTPVTIGNTEIDIELEKEIEIEKKPQKTKYADRVSMTVEEYEKLISEYGEKLITDKITDLDLWKGSKGKSTKSDYLTIKAWIRRENKDKPIQQQVFDRSKYIE